jgi:hypothetical protein
MVKLSFNHSLRQAPAVSISEHSRPGNHTTLSSSIQKIEAFKSSPVLLPTDRLGSDSILQCNSRSTGTGSQSVIDGFLTKQKLYRIIRNGNTK